MLSGNPQKENYNLLHNAAKEKVNHFRPFKCGRYKSARPLAPRAAEPRRLRLCARRHLLLLKFLLQLFFSIHKSMCKFELSHIMTVFMSGGCKHHSHDV